jgi:sec-independent protein translocase protein TatA
VLEHSLNIIGSEWVIIIFLALILLLGANRFPEIATKLGKTVGKYNKAKNKIQNEMKDFSKENLEISGPVKNEREKLDIIAKTIGVDSKNKTDDQLKRIITNKMGSSQEETLDKK